MTRRMTERAAVCVLIGAYLAGPAVAAVPPSEGTGGSFCQAALEPPTRPLRVTPEQIAALEQLAEQPAYAVAPDTPAAYSFKAQKQATEISAVAFYFGYAGALAWVLIAAAPL